MTKRCSLVAAVCAAALALSSCASWDTPIEPVAVEATGDPRTTQGASIISQVPEVEPVTATPQHLLPVSLTDADGYDVEVTDTSRILALDLYGTYTKTLRGLGLGDNIIGRTVSSDEPSLADRPVVTENGHSLNVEAILNLAPSLVIVDHSVGPQEAIDQIRAAGVTTVVMEPQRSIDSIGADIETLAAVVGEPEAGAELAERSERELQQAKEAIAKVVPEQPLRMSFLYARGTGGVFYLLGEEAATDDLIGALGGVDVNTQNGIGAPSPASPEALAEVNPEVFVMMTGGLKSTGDIEGLLQRPGVAQTIAGQNRRVLALPDGDSLAFGPQTGQLLLSAANALYGGQQS
ncbi:heme/hemin ABC transporter substrate-binding protein [Corynebacterium timonense]|uniref:Iron complex transport system substrate-binding protein n=1 Tax=Corynebacterium timonense TaxID=441500 RepID=A0A1H1QVS3_9CORY|nr:ABC transporter substrate-binding protein [Corynebacterium timonense]SDS27550.1 iron complex transport system substrate-binding protein [Corynebacterium timonense]